MDYWFEMSYYWLDEELSINERLHNYQSDILDDLNNFNFDIEEMN